MSDNFDLTSANAVVILSVDELYPKAEAFIAEVKDLIEE